MACSGNSQNLRRDSSSLQNGDPDEIPGEDEDEGILQDDTELEDEEDDD